MEIAKLILEYLKVLSWPIVVLILFLLVRKEILKVLQRVSNLEFNIKDWKMRLETTGKLLKRQSDPQKNSTDPGTTYDASVLLSLNDEDFRFLTSLSEKAVPLIYFPSSQEETYRLNSLCNENIFKKSENNDDGYILTDLGKNIFDAITIP